MQIFTHKVDFTNFKIDTEYLSMAQQSSYVGQGLTILVVWYSKQNLRYEDSFDCIVVIVVIIDI